MRVSLALLLVRAFILVALGISIALLLDYTSPDPAFCGGATGCAAVRESGFGHLSFGGSTTLPIPALGVAAFLTLFVLSLLSQRPWVHRVLRLLTGLGALLAACFVGLMLWLGSVCSLCLAVDGSMLLVAGLWFFHDAQLRSGATARSLVSLPAWLGLLGIVMLAPLLYPRLVSGREVPAVIAEMYRPGEITVLEFFDFQCPHCRDLSPRLSRLVERVDQAQLRFGYVPLPGHEAARKAARYCICAGEQNQESALVHRYLEQQDLGEAALLQTAHAVVPHVEALSACLASTRPDQRIKSDTQALKTAGFVGLPTTYIGGLRILGAEHDRVYQDALMKVQQGKDRTGLPPWLYWCCVAVAAGSVMYLGREPQAA